MVSNKTMRRLLVIIIILIFFIIIGIVALKNTFIEKNNSSNNMINVSKTKKIEEINEMSGSEIMNASIDPNDKTTGLGFWKYSTKIGKIIIKVSDDMPEIPEGININYKWDVSKKQDASVIAYIDNMYDDSYNLYICSKGKVILPADSSCFFRNFTHIKSFEGIEYLDTSNVTNMASFFESFGYYSLYGMDLPENFNTSKVTNMDSMFKNCGFKKMQELNLGNSFYTSNVVNFNSMFFRCGFEKIESLKLGENFDTSKAKSMIMMFRECGENSLKSIELGNLFNIDNKDQECTKDIFLNCGKQNECSITRNGKNINDIN